MKNLKPTTDPNSFW